MRKILFIIFFFVCLFLLTMMTAYSQVTIPDQVARFYLEQNEKVKLYEKQVVIKDELIDNLNQQIGTKNIIINTFKNDSVSYQGLIKTYKHQIAFKEREIELKDKEIKKAKRQRNIIAGAGTGAIVGSVIGQPLIGAGVGSVVGLVVSWIKK